jgi:hypothetical protein
MRLRQKLFLGYMIIGVIAVGAEWFTLNELKKITESFEKNLPEKVQSLVNASREDDLSKLIRYYDEVLTQSARNYAFTQDKKWETRYRNIEPKLDAAIKEAIQGGDQVDSAFFSNVDKANLALVKMEYASIELVNSSRAEGAVKILEGGDYWTQKALYAKGLDDYVEKRKDREGSASDDLMTTVDSAIRQNQLLIGQYTWMVLISVIIVCAATIAIPVLVLRTFSEPSQQ